MVSTPAVRFENVGKVYAGKRGSLRALDGVSFDIEPVSYTHLTLPTNREV